MFIFNVLKDTVKLFFFEGIDNLFGFYRVSLYIFIRFIIIIINKFEGILEEQRKR